MWLSVKERMPPPLNPALDRPSLGLLLESDPGAEKNVLRPRQTAKLFGLRSKLSLHGRPPPNAMPKTTQKLRPPQLNPI